MLTRITWTLILGGFLVVVDSAQYFGTQIGKFKTYYHEVVGDIYAVDDKTLFIKGFTYDGAGPDAFFWAGNTKKPDTTGTIIPDEKGQVKPLSPYRNKDLVLRLPEGKTLKDFKWLSVWCRKFRANFGDVLIGADLEIPEPAEIGELSQLQHGVSSGPITMMDAQTFLIRDFTYDGEGPAAYWWSSQGAKQHPRGTRLPDENGNNAPLRRYAGETVIIQLPADKTYLDFDWLGVWCEEFNADFGNIQIAHDIKVPPSPRMLGMKSENKLNCEVMHDEIGFELRWVMDGDQIVMQMVGKADPGEYLAFGLSKNDQKSEMINADSIVAWVDSNGKGHVVDYFLGTKEQCVGDRGSCPDTKHRGAKDGTSLLSASLINGFTSVTVKRPQAAQDEELDQNIYSDGPQAVMWAVGPLNNRNEVSYHRLRTNGNMLIDFARAAKWNCPPPDTVQPKRRPPVPKPTKAPIKTTTTPKPTVPPPPPPTPRPQRVRPQGVRPQNRRPANPRPTPTPQPVPAFNARKPQNNLRNQQGLRNQFGGQNVKPPLATRGQPAVANNQQSSRQSEAWQIPEIVCPTDRTFKFQIGPSSGKKGYQGITGKVGWGVAWWVNGLLVPELTVQRGKVYTFMVEGGLDNDDSAKHHPLYITSDPEGGYEFKDNTQRGQERVYAGVGRDRRGKPFPSAAGRLCEYKISVNDKNAPESYRTFEDFKQTLKVDCDEGEPGVLRWRPNRNTPDLVYYQCYTHRLLGWKIHVVDSCDDYEAQASFVHSQNISGPVYAQALSMNKTDDSRPNSFHSKPESDKNMPNLFGRRKKNPFGQPHSVIRSNALVGHSLKPPHDVEHSNPSGAVLDEGVFVSPGTAGSRHQNSGAPQEPILAGGNGFNKPLTAQNNDRDFFLVPVQQNFFLGQRVPHGPPNVLQSSGPNGIPPPSDLPRIEIGQTVRHDAFDKPRTGFGGAASTLGGNKRVYYHGGFVPVIYNNGTFESRMPDPTTPPPGFNRPFPFKVNDSIPFQGSFKPGKPDFSGFTIPKQSSSQKNKHDFQYHSQPSNREPVVRPASPLPEKLQPQLLNLGRPETVDAPSSKEFIASQRKPIPQRVVTEIPRIAITVETRTSTPAPVDPLPLKITEQTPVFIEPSSNDKDEEITAESQSKVVSVPEEMVQKLPEVVTSVSESFSFESSDRVKEIAVVSSTSTEPDIFNFGPSEETKQSNNNTDYSILSHVMSLISSQTQSEQNKPSEVQTARIKRDAKPQQHDHSHEGHDHNHAEHDHSHDGHDHQSTNKTQSSESNVTAGSTTTYLTALTLIGLVVNILMICL